MAGHIGIVACSFAGAALTYRTIASEGGQAMGKGFHPVITLHSIPMGEYMKHLTTGDLEGVADLLAKSAGECAKTGANFAICPDNSVHAAFDKMIAKSPIPWLHIAEETAKVAVEKGFKHLGVLGVKGVMEGAVYRSKLEVAGITYTIPEEADRQKIHDIVYGELVQGIYKEETKKYFAEIVKQFKQKGCDGVVLACTDLPPVLNESNSVLPTLDSAIILARAALKKAVEL